MPDFNFHIAYCDGNKNYYRISDEESGLKLVLIPFEHYHETIFGISSVNSPDYRLPEKTIYNLHAETEFATDPVVNKIPEIKCSLTREQYIKTIEKIKEHIHRGDIYEINFCFEFFAENALIDPFRVFDKLLKTARAPFSSLTKINGLYLICASPERFLKKKGEKIISEPMKGTSPRNEDPAIDEKNKNALRESKKEQNENVMVVDLVRNDLSKIASRGTVKVEELFGIKSFATVHQMISTISCINNNHSFDEILQATFPMGSMTGVPKKRMLELTTGFEKKPRGIYSGTIGIIDPSGDFDLAVIIRSIVYDAKNKYLSFSVGSAITSGCIPEKEYEECLLKAKTMIEVLKN